MVPATALAAAFLLGTLVAGFRRSKAKGISSTEAAGLWSLWKNIAGPQRAARTTIVLDDNFNASVQEHRSLFGFPKPRVFLTIGLPLLAVMDDKAIAAVLAHEEAHVRNRDTNGSLSLAELEKTFEFVFEFAPPGQSISGTLLHAALDWMSTSFERENIRLSRDAEIKADRSAADSKDVEQAARALLLMAAATDLLDEKVYEPLQAELLGAMHPPRPPLDRIIEVAGQLSDPEVLQRHARKGWEKADDEKSTHPSFAQRLSALGLASPPNVEPVAVPALSALLHESFAKQKIAEFNKQWTREIANALRR